MTFAMSALHDRDSYYLSMAREKEASAANRSVQLVGVNSESSHTVPELVSFRTDIADASAKLLGFSVYVIGEHNSSRCKIGIARNPIKRLATLQTGNPEALFIHRVFWVESEQYAKNIESDAHISAELEHRRLEGEWFECSPYQAFNHIKYVCDAGNYNYFAASPEVHNG